MQDEQQPDLVGLSAEIVSAYVAKNHIQTSELSQLIASVHGALTNVGKPAPEPEKHEPEAPSVEPRPHPGAVSPEVGSTTRLSDGRGQLRQDSIRVGEGDCLGQKRKGRKRAAKKDSAA